MVDYPEMRRISNVVDEIETASTYHSVDRRASETKTCSYRKHTQKRETVGRCVDLLLMLSDVGLVKRERLGLGTKLLEDAPIGSTGWITAEP